MPNCFQLISKETGKPAVFAHIDTEMRIALGEPPDEDKYLHSWYDIVGLALAMGAELPAIRERFTNGESPWPEMVKIVDYLDEHYTSKAWAERSRRNRDL